MYAASAIFCTKTKIMNIENTITQEELHKIFDEVEQRHPSLRKGQAFFNTLPLKTAEEIRGTELDPFYNDNRLPDCVNAVLGLPF